ncbi:MAG: inositol monophosphatase family protein [Sphaerochaeta sp.]
MTEKDIVEHLQVAITAANRAGAFVLKAEKQGNHAIRQKQANDFVTETDRLSEDLIISIIMEHFPSDAIFGEETGSSGTLENGRWIIDPIDGTTNFFRSLPDYSISIAWEKDPFKPLVGVVFNPRQNELFWASKGGGAFLNGKPIQVSRLKEPSHAIIVCVPPHRHHTLAVPYFENMYRIFLEASDLRSYGSCALELSYIAAGRIDGYYELCLGYYDMAAGICILEEAGGSFSPADPLVPFSDSRCDLVASNGLIQDWLFHMVQE